MDNKIPINQNLLFVGGDLSGIQKFLYNITSKKAAVSLKGRSKYLEMLIEDVEKRILNLPPINNSFSYEVYASGGKFYILVEDTPDIRQAIIDERSRIETELWNEHHGQLSISIGYVPFAFNNNKTIRIANDNQAPLGSLWSEVNALFTQQKNRKFESVIRKNYELFFGKQSVGGDIHVCAITGIESNDCIKLDKDIDGDEIYVLPSVKKQIDLGIELRKQQNFKTFEQYAGESWLGILRMDVDGLGKAFIKGFPTFDEYRAFSTLLTNFFKEKVFTIQAFDDYKEFLNIIYSGGDDMFVVGRWDKVIDFSHVVRDAFISHINHSDITISGGIAIVNPKFPISKAAELSGEAEDAAKTFRNGEKNAFNMFGISISWDGEFKFVQDLKKKMCELNKYNQMPTAILHRLILFNNMRQHNEMKYIWNTAYYLSQFEKGKDSQITQFCEQLKQQLLCSQNNNDRNYELIALAARWAEIEIRENN